MFKSMNKALSRRGKESHKFRCARATRDAMRARVS